MASQNWHILCCVFFLSLLTVIVTGERTKDKMFESITGTAACFRRLNGTHQVGCASSRNGNVGVLHVVEDAEDLAWLLKSGVAGPYIAVLHPAMFTSAVLTSLKASRKVSGVLLANNGSSADRPARYSPEDTCPNRYSGLTAGCDLDGAPWNPDGERLLLVDWGFPMFHVRDQKTIDKVYACHEKHNAHDRDSQKSRALCALEMNAFMLAAVDSATCIRRSHLMTNFNPVRYCDPLGDRNVWSTLFPRSKLAPSPSPNPLVMLTARLDATSMFDDLVPGASTPVTGVVALLATARMLALMLPPRDGQHDNHTNVLFALLHGEAYDYIGSSRLVYDMKRGEFPSVLDPSVADQPPPIRPSDVGLYLELSQLGAWRDRTVFLHRAASNSVKTRAQLSEVVSKLREIGAEHGLTFTSYNGSSLPPASLQTLLKEEPDLPGLVMADHGPRFANRYYHSLFDDAQQLGYVYGNGGELPQDSIQRFIANVSTTLAKTLYTVITSKNYTGQHNAANLTMIDELFHCYLETMNCSLFRAAAPRTLALPNRQAGHYVGVSGNYNLVTTLTGLVLALLTGERTNASEHDCHTDHENQVFQNLWMPDFTSGSGNDTGVCMRTTMNFSEALSPAFLDDGYDWSSGRYSTWTESIWLTFSVRMFLKPSAAHEALTLAIGIVVLVFSFLAVYFVNNKSAVLFGNTLAAC